MPVQRRLLQPLYARALTSPATRRFWRAAHDWLDRAAQRPPRLTVWLRLDHPASYLLAQWLPRLNEAYATETDIRLVPAGAGFHPSESVDAWQQAQRHQLAFHALTPPSAADCRLAERIWPATGHMPAPDRLRLLRQLFDCVWEHHGGKLETLALRFPPPEPEDAPPRRAVPDPEGPLAGRLRFRREFFLGVDDLPALAARLNAAGLARGEHPGVPGLPAATGHGFLVSDPEMLATIRSRRYRLDYYFCFRDPYSYLNLADAFALADHYGLRLQLHPVTLPDMPGTEGLTDIPRLWRCSRRAESLGLPFGRIRLPDPDGIRQAHALLELARRQGAERDMARAILEGIWAGARDPGHAGHRAILRAATARGQADATATVTPDRKHQDWLALDTPVLPAWALHAGRRVTAGGDDRAWALDMALADTLNE